MTFLIIILAIALQVFLTYKKVSPFLSLLLISILTGIFLGMDTTAILKSIETGVGSTLGSLALIICLGAILGRILEVSGAAEKIAVTLIRSFGKKNIQWAVLLTGFLIGIPLYYNAGFVILVPLIFSIAKKANLPLLYVAIPMAAALSATHCFLPPHPAPVFLVNSFKANLGKTLVYGIIITIPVVMIAGPLLGRTLKKIHVDVPPIFFPAAVGAERKLPPAFPSFFIGLLPVVLITVAVMAHNLVPANSTPLSIMLFAGDPTIALLISVLVATWYFGLRTGESVQTTMKWVHEAIAGIAVIILIITSGGVLKQVLQDSGAGDYISSFSRQWQMSPLIFGWLVTALLRVTIGSATVAGMTAAGILVPLIGSSNVSPELMVLAVGTGSVFGSHINDSGFWMFKEFLGLSLKQTFLSWTLMETSISVLGLGGVLLLNLFI